MQMQRKIKKERIEKIQEREIRILDRDLMVIDQTLRKGFVTNQGVRELVYNNGSSVNAISNRMMELVAHGYIKAIRYQGMPFGNESKLDSAGYGPTTKGLQLLYPEISQEIKIRDNNITTGYLIDKGLRLLKKGGVPIDEVLTNTDLKRHTIIDNLDIDDDIKKSIRGYITPFEKGHPFHLCIRGRNERQERKERGEKAKRIDFANEAKYYIYFCPWKIVRYQGSGKIGQDEKAVYRALNEMATKIDSGDKIFVVCNEKDYQNNLNVLLGFSRPKNTNIHLITFETMVEIIKPLIYYPGFYRSFPERDFSLRKEFDGFSTVGSKDPKEGFLYVTEIITGNLNTFWKLLTYERERKVIVYGFKHQVEQFRGLKEYKLMQLESGDISAYHDEFKIG